MIKKNFLLCGVIITVLGCKTVAVNNTQQTVTTQYISLGSIGLDKDFIIQSGFNNTALPNYKEPIKVSIEKVPFTKQTHKAFIKANTLQSYNVSINYIDSLDAKPQFVQIKIVDKVAIINALNDKTNSDIKAYLKYNTSANIVTSISIALNKENMDTVEKSDAVFLIETGFKTYALQIQKANQKPKIIRFNDGAVFAYKSSYFCWQENNKYQLQIVDLVNKCNNCPSKTYRNSARAKKKINYFKL